jgi:hypothetical protein
VLASIELMRSGLLDEMLVRFSSSLSVSATSLGERLVVAACALLVNAVEGVEESAGVFGVLSPII